jgi:protein-S-isoprenylcysteine O-methyltransferase Ste14
MTQSLVYINFYLFLFAFVVALVKNLNVTTLLVGLIYLAPLVPLGFEEQYADRFLITSYLNLIFGLLELVLFVLTVHKGDASFTKEYFAQLFGHTLPIAFALLFTSFSARSSSDPVLFWEWGLIAVLFLAGAILRALAVYQIGLLGFKFDIAFRAEQTLKTDQLYRWMRHPTYAGMMVVILAYAINAHSWLIGILAMFSAWFGFQFRIHHEEKALEKQFGEAYRRYRSKTNAWGII